MGERHQGADCVVRAADELVVPSDVCEVRAEADVAVAGERVGKRARRVLVEIEHPDARARGGERGSDRGADRPGGAGDQHALPREARAEGLCRRLRRAHDRGETRYASM